MEEDCQKALEKLTLFFLSNPGPFNGQSYQKQKGPGTSDQSLFRLRNKLRKFPLLVSIIWIIFFPKITLQIYVNQFMTSKLFRVHLSFWICNVWKGREAVTKIWIFREKKELFRRNIKTILIVFERLSFGEKKKLIKIAVSWLGQLNTGVATMFLVTWLIFHC